MAVLTNLPVPVDQLRHTDQWVDVTATLKKVDDGDTVWVTVKDPNGKPQDLKIRLAGIDSPEDGPGYTQSDGFDAGAKATANAAKYFDGAGNLTITVGPNVDDYNRAIGFVKRDDKDVSLNYQQVSDGYAHLAPAYQAEALTKDPEVWAKYQKADTEAQAEKKGIWGNPNKNTDPAVWRKQHDYLNAAEFVEVLITLKLSDASSGGQIKNLKVFKDGRRLTVADDATGIQDRLESGKSYAVYTINADGYESAEVSVSRDDADVKSQKKAYKTATLYKTGSTEDVTVTVLAGSDPVEGVKVTVAGSRQETDGDGTATWEGIGIGDQTITVDPSGVEDYDEDGNPITYDAKSEQVKISPDNTDIEIQLVSKSDKKAATIANVTGFNDGQTADQQRAALDSLSLPEVNSEAIDESNTSYDGYFTSAQVKVFIGNIFLDELVSIEWTLNQNIVPLFGYCSRDADAFAEGRSLIQGQILLNYIAPWYLGVAVRKHYEDAPASDQEPRDSEIEQLATAIAQGKVPDNIADFDSTQVAQANARAKELKAMGINEKPDNNPAVYKRLTFHIIIQYGDNPKNRRMLRDCKLTSCNQVTDQSGNPTFESYGFVGRVAI